MSSFFIFTLHMQNSILPFQIWREYDSDNSGYIEADELKNFLRDLLKEAKKINDVSEDKLIEYTDTMVQYDSIQKSFFHLSILLSCSFPFLPIASFSVTSV